MLGGAKCHVDGGLEGAGWVSRCGVALLRWTTKHPRGCQAPAMRTYPPSITHLPPTRKPALWQLSMFGYLGGGGSISDGLGGVADLGSWAAAPAGH